MDCVDINRMKNLVSYDSTHRQLQSMLIDSNVIQDVYLLAFEFMRYSST